MHLLWQNKYLVFTQKHPEKVSSIDKSCGTGPDCAKWHVCFISNCLQFIWEKATHQKLLWWTLSSVKM